MGRRDHKQRSRAAFDRQASTYDSSGYGRHARRLHDEVVAAALSFQFAAVLDVGCGTGATLDAVVRAHPDVHAWGIDLSAEMIGKARERLAAVGARAGGPVDLQVADAEHGVQEAHCGPWWQVVKLGFYALGRKFAGRWGSAAETGLCG